MLGTGSAGTVFAADKVSTIDLLYEPRDGVRRIRGIGGAEVVFTKQLDRQSVGELWTDDAEIEVGAMNYCVEIDGILGVNFLIRTGAVVDLARTEDRQAP